MKNPPFDLIVLGAGSGGLAAAKRASSYGAKVAIIEGDRVGGTCVIRGCVPKKLLLYGSLYNEHIKNASSFGVEFKDACIDSSQLLKNVRSEVDRLNSLHIDLLEKSGVTLFNGWGKLADSHVVLVREKGNVDKITELYGERILIATGGYPNRPLIPGSELGWLSDDIFLLNELPENVVIFGAGFIACEFSCILNGLGVKVKQFIRGKTILKGFDKELSNLLVEYMQENGIELNFGQYPVSISGNPGDLKVHTNSVEIKNCGGVLFATGRKPLINDLGLSSAGIDIDLDKVIVDENQVTNIPNIYAVGDVTNRINLTPVAVDEGRAFADTVFGKKTRQVNYNFVPSAVFSHPEIAAVGLTEEKAIALYGEVNLRSYRAKFRSMANALPKRGAPCLLKLITERKSQKILGCHMVGDHSAEIIQMAAIALQMGATKLDFDRTMALHPTIAEEFVTMI
ncbi:glutathione-disulfide reductase [Prochlorococcus sp. MIT 1307]|uniref:glutathione-disulfide reductase n=1 Tax=Prochlorococcus sp. MIT 1307 TaxID=3096219 RepID=UPI002A75B69C|nr:glutathione-disulfide reductase [Prochlorococcus sp. MIT 1307]